MAIRLGVLGPSLNPVGSTQHNQPIIENFINVDCVTLPAGIPVFLAGNGNLDGLGVITPNSQGVGNINNAVFGGVTITLNPVTAGGVAINGVVDCVVRNMHIGARITLQTRSASSAAYASWSAISVGDMLSIETVNNGFARLGGGGQTGVQTGGAYAVAFAPFASGTTQASSFASGTQTVAGTVFTTQSGTASTAPTTTSLIYTYTLQTNASAIFATGKVFVRSM
jgi:hypothetical protein